MSKKRFQIEGETPSARRAKQKVTLTALQAQVVATPAGKERSALRRDLRARGLLGG